MNHFSQNQLIRQRSVMNFIKSFKTIFLGYWSVIILCCFAGLSIGVSIDVFENKQDQYSAEIIFDITGGKENTGQNRLSGMFDSGAAINDNLLAGENFFYFVKSRPVLERNLMKTMNIEGNNVLLANLFIDSSGIRDEEWKKGSTLHHFKFKKACIDSLDTVSRVALNALTSKARKLTEVTSFERKSSFKKLSATTRSQILTTIWVSSMLKTIEEVYEEKKSEKVQKALLLLKNREDSLTRLIAIKDLVLAIETDKTSNLTTQEGKIAPKKLRMETDFLHNLSEQTILETEQMRMTLAGKEPLFVIIEEVSSPLSVIPGYKKGKVLGFLAGIITALFFTALKCGRTAGEPVNPRLCPPWKDHFLSNLLKGLFK